MEEFAVVEELTWEKAKAFLRKVKEEKSVSVPTVRKWKSAYINLWRWLDERPDVWTNHTFQKEVKVSRQEWTKDEVAYLYKTLCEKNDKISHWLKHAVWIAAHTGARQGAIAELEYNSSDQTIFFPAKKKSRNKVEQYQRIQLYERVFVSGLKIGKQLTAFQIDLVNLKSHLAIQIR